jgi:hypothetical protein
MRPRRYGMSELRKTDRFLIFADILGFADVTEKHVIESAKLSEYVPLHLAFTRFASTSRKNRKNHLTEIFQSFHGIVETFLKLAQVQRPYTAISFSDSMFLAVDDFFEAAHCAVILQKYFLNSKVPVRMGLAFGSFIALNFRSDVSAHRAEHSSQFLGTAVVRAVQAEKCGIKGMRILLHPSIHRFLTLLETQPATSENLTRGPLRSIDCPASERENPVGVRYELSFWNGDLITSEDDMWEGFQLMWSSAPSSAKSHYRSTAEAINRMRVANGEESISNLKRKTLPRQLPRTK